MSEPSFAAQTLHHIRNRVKARDMKLTHTSDTLDAMEWADLLYLARDYGIGIDHVSVDRREIITAIVDKQIEQRKAVAEAPTHSPDQFRRGVYRFYVKGSDRPRLGVVFAIQSSGEKFVQLSTEGSANHLEEFLKGVTHFDFVCDR